MKTVQAKSRRERGLLLPLLLILVGVVFLLERNGLIDRHFIWQWLPLLPIFIGGTLLVRRLNHHPE